MAKRKDIRPAESALFNEISTLIEQTQAQVVSQINSVLTMLFWQVGRRINAFVLEHKRAEYGKQIVVTLSLQLEERYGRNFKDPYQLDFLNLPAGYLEFDLETAILKELEKFILEVGKGFAFVERQKRMIIDGEDYYLDLLVYHRKLKRLVAIELKIGKFQAKHKGQIELYLKWLNKHERQEGEEVPVGLILCAETSREQVELLEMHKDGIMVAEYWTELPPRKELENRLHKAYLEAKEMMDRRKLLD
jgi:predicted nuclease of restriction endonuclease-like (RecB) superfamily